MRYPGVAVRWGVLDLAITYRYPRFISTTACIIAFQTTPRRRLAAGMGRKWRKQHREKVIYLLACGNLVALQIGYSLLVPSRKSSEDPNLQLRNNKERSPLPANAKNDRSHRFQEPKNVEAFLWELQQEALKKESSLRFDWTNLPPMTPLDEPSSKVSRNVSIAMRSRSMDPNILYAFT